MQNHQINLASIQSRSSKRSEGTYEFLVEIDNNSTKGDFQTAMNDLKDKTKYLQVIGRDYKDSPDTIPWFPRNIKVSFWAMFSHNFSFSILTLKWLKITKIMSAAYVGCRQKKNRAWTAEKSKKIISSD